MKKSKIKKDDKEAVADKSINQNLPVKTDATDSIENTAKQTVGLNETKTLADNQFPSDGSNLTN